MKRCRITLMDQEGCEAALAERIRGWMRTHPVIKEVELVPVAGHHYYAIHINGAPEPVPGVVLAEEDLTDPEVLIQTLEAAYIVYDHEVGAWD